MPTRAGSVDDDAKKRIKDRKKEQEKALKDIFSDNETGRYSDSMKG